MNTVKQLLLPKNTSSICNICVEEHKLEEVISYLINKNIQFSVTYATQELTNSVGSSNIQNDDYQDEIIQFIENHIHECLAKNIHFDLEDVAQQNQVTSFYLKQIFKEKHNISAYQFYMNERMKLAASLLEQGYKANSVSGMIGYGEKSAIKFNKMFQKHFGVTPKKYQLKNTVLHRRRAKLQ